MYLIHYYNIYLLIYNNIWGDYYYSSFKGHWGEKHLLKVICPRLQRMLLELTSGSSYTNSMYFSLPDPERWGPIYKSYGY